MSENTAPAGGVTRDELRERLLAIIESRRMEPWTDRGRPCCVMCGARWDGEHKAECWVPTLREAADLLAQQEALVTALRAIVDMEPEPFDFPADWSQQVAACEECKRWKNHPIQLGICDTHRQAFWDRDAHEKSEQLRLHYRMRSVAREALATLQEAREGPDTLMKAEREIRSLDVDADARRLAALHQLIAWWDDTSWGSPRWIAELAAIVENCRAAAMAADTQTEGESDGPV